MLNLFSFTKKFIGCSFDFLLTELIRNVKAINDFPFSIGSGAWE